LVRKAYQHFKAGDNQSVLNVLAEDVLWELPDMANVPFAGTWQGRQQVVTYFRRLVESQEVIEFEPEEFIFHGDKVFSWDTSLCASELWPEIRAPHGFTFGL
jgi:ketosteroid isomerase-like protein